MSRLSPYRRIERATYRDVGVRFVAANLQPGHDTIATLRRAKKAAFAAAVAGFGVIKCVLGFRRFRLLGLPNIDTE